MAAAQQFAGGRQPREYMPAGSSTGYGHFHGNAPSTDNKWRFQAKPAENPPSPPPAATTRWQGMNKGSGFAPQAPPVARAAPA